MLIFSGNCGYDGWECFMTEKIREFVIWRSVWAASPKMTGAWIMALNFLSPSMTLISGPCVPKRALWNKSCSKKCFWSFLNYVFWPLTLIWHTFNRPTTLCSTQKINRITGNSSYEKFFSVFTYILTFPLDFSKIKCRELELSFKAVI